MKLLKIFKGKPLKRVEVKVHSDNSRVRLRASRTSGVNASIKLGKYASFNTKHGFRISRTIKGLTLGLRRGGAIIRGRWSNSNNLLNLNLSKSGFTISSSSRFGTYNWTKPNRSSFKLGGIQLRGKKAKDLAFLTSLIAIIFVLIKYIFYFITAHIRLFIFLVIYLINFIFEQIHLFVIDVPLLFRRERFSENYLSDAMLFVDNIPEREAIDIQKFDKRLAIILGVGPFIYEFMGGYLEESNNINLPPLVNTIESFINWASPIILFCSNYIFLILGIGFILSMLNMAVDWLVYKLAKDKISE